MRPPAESVVYVGGQSPLVLLLEPVLRMSIGKSDEDLISPQEGLISQFDLVLDGYDLIVDLPQTGIESIDLVGIALAF
jgi:hypothetical protein